MLNEFLQQGANRLLLGRFQTPPSQSQVAMAPVADEAGRAAPVGPPPSFIQVAKPYIFQQQLQGQLIAIGTNPTREDTFRIQGVQWIGEVRKALQL
jgi:CTD kinase subunit beta